MLHDNTKDYPEASTFFFFWSGAEATCTQAWIALVQEQDISHLSLHGDGIRLAGNTTTDVDAICREGASRIRERTRFSVQIRVKHDFLLLEQLKARSRAQSSARAECNLVYLVGDCIIASLVDIGVVSVSAADKLLTPVYT